MSEAVRDIASTRCVLYVDTDNQCHRLASTVLASLRARGLQPQCAFLFGNNHGCALTQWHATLLQDAALTRSIHVRMVPAHPQAADVALILTVGENLRGHRAVDATIVIVSADVALAACAERLAAGGAKCLLVHDAGAQPAPLPHSVVPRVAVQRGPRDAAADRGKASRRQHLLALVRLRARRAGDGFLKSSVGQVLRDAGLGRRQRERFLAQLPGLRHQAIAGDHVLFIPEVP